jgi:hypothetical protein
VNYFLVGSFGNGVVSVFTAVVAVAFAAVVVVATVFLDCFLKKRDRGQGQVVGWACVVEATLNIPSAPCMFS